MEELFAEERNAIELLSALSEGMFLPAWSISWNYYLNLECQFRAPLSKPIQVLSATKKVLSLAKLESIVELKSSLPQIFCVLEKMMWDRQKLKQ